MKTVSSIFSFPRKEAYSRAPLPLALGDVVPTAVSLLEIPRAAIVYRCGSGCVRHTQRNVHAGVWYWVNKSHDPRLLCSLIRFQNRRPATKRRINPPRAARHSPSQPPIHVIRRLAPFGISFFQWSSFSPSFLSSFLPSFLPSFFLPSYLPSSLTYIIFLCLSVWLSGSFSLLFLFLSHSLSVSEPQSVLLSLSISPLSRPIY